MIRATHHWLIAPFFDCYTLFQVKRHFKRVVFDIANADSGLPLFVIANHISWWDGFWINYLNLKMFKRRFYFMMLEEQLHKHWFFRYAGGFSVKKHSRSAIDSIVYASQLLADCRNMVLVFPQGAIQSTYTREFIFEKGIESIFKRVSTDFQILFIANLVDYYSSPSPSLFVHVEVCECRTVDAIQQAYNRFYNEALVKHMLLKPL
jgi:1-acyl-sn-glycerol-3-phosphate acyltransferase